MAIFEYQARRRSGDKVSGELTAGDRRACMLELQHMGLIPISVQERTAGKTKARKQTSGARFQLRRAQRMTMREVLVFTTELSDLIASGMTLGNALNSLARRRSGRTGDAILANIRDDVLGGSSLSEALAMHPKTFSDLYVNMIKAGEASGALHEVLQRVVGHYERMQELREKITMALVYPVIVLVFGTGVLVYAMVKIVPQFQVVFDQLGSELPGSTQLLIDMSGFLTRYGILVAAGILVGIILVIRFVKTKAGRFWWHRLQLRTPLVRGIVASAVFTNFARTLGTLLTNGVPVLRALAIVERTVGNVVIGKEIHNARDRVTDGTSISGPLAAGKMFPPLLTDMLAVGEQTGDMAGALTHIARRYEDDLNRNVRVFTTALEPLLIVVVALMVGFVAVSILTAVFSMSDGLNA